MSSQSTDLVSEYNFSERSTTSVSDSVLNWWNVCLANHRVSLEYSSNDWDVETLELSKKYLYNYYNRASVGESVGVLSFWSQFKQLVPVVSETHEFVTIGTYSQCVNNNSNYNPNEQSNTFQPRLELNQ